MGDINENIIAFHLYGKRDGSECFNWGGTTYYEEEKKILVNGNPSIERDGSKISCGLIIIYPDTNRILLSDGLGNIKEK